MSSCRTAPTRAVPCLRRADIAAPSVHFAEEGGERHQEELVALLVADMQRPVAPILRTAIIDERGHDAGATVARVAPILDLAAAPIQQHLVGAGAVEVNVCHLRLLVRCS